MNCSCLTCSKLENANCPGNVSKTYLWWAIDHLNSGQKCTFSITIQLFVQDVQSSTQGISAGCKTL